MRRVPRWTITFADVGERNIHSRHSRGDSPRSANAWLLSHRSSASPWVVRDGVVVDGERRQEVGYHMTRV
jgi:hypothetical protein